MKELNKLFSEIEFQYQDESMKYRRLKICRYSFEISKVVILSLSTGLALYFNICHFKYDFNPNYRFNKTQ